MVASDKSLLRRQVLGLLATGGAAAGVAGAPASASAAAVAKPETRTDKARARYHVTDDVKAYYRVNRYPGRDA